MSRVTFCSGATHGPIVIATKTASIAAHVDLHQSDAIRAMGRWSVVFVLLLANYYASQNCYKLNDDVLLEETSRLETRCQNQGFCS